MVHINLLQDTLLSLRLIDNQYNSASKDRVPPTVALEEIPSPSKIGEQQRLQRLKWGLSLYNKPPKISPDYSPRPPQSARSPLTENDRKRYTQSLRARRKIYKTPRTAHSDITPRFPEQPDRLLGQPIQITDKVHIGANGLCYLSTGHEIYQGARSCILGKTTKRTSVSAHINQQIKKETYNKYHIERIAKKESNRIRARKEKYPFLYDDDKPVPARMHTGERALIQRVQKIMVENGRGPAQLHPDKPQPHIPDVRWWRFTERGKGMAKRRLDLTLRKTYAPKYAMTERRERSVKFATHPYKKRSDEKGVTPLDLGIQIRKTKMLRKQQKTLDLMCRDIGADLKADGRKGLRHVKGGTFQRTETGRNLTRR